MTALGRGKPDQVPVSLSIGPTNASQWIGRSDARAVCQAHQLVGSIPTYGYDGDRICLMGGYDPQVYVSGSLEEIRRETIRCIDEAAAGGGYILDNSDALPPDAEMEDVRAMVQIAGEYGRYG